jgi:rare lipoprotein A
LNFPDGGVVEVEVKLNGPETAALDGALGEGPKLTADPVAGITAQSLGPPGSASGAAQNLAPAQSGPAAPATVQLSGQVTITSPAPGPLFVQIPGFGQEFDAYTAMQRLSGMDAQIVPEFNGDRTLYAVNIGPYHSVEDADAALKQVLGMGVADPEIIVR